MRRREFIRCSATQRPGRWWRTHNNAPLGCGFRSPMTRQVSQRCKKTIEQRWDGSADCAKTA